MRRLQPKKNMPNTTVRDKTHMTAIWTTLMMKRLLSSEAAATKPLSVTTDERLQQKNSSVLLNSPPSVWLNPVLFISSFLKVQLSVQVTAERERRAWRNPRESVIKWKVKMVNRRLQQVPSDQTEPLVEFNKPLWHRITGDFVCSAASFGAEWIHQPAVK